MTRRIVLDYGSIKARVRFGMFSLLFLGIVAMPLALIEPVQAASDNSFSGQITASDGSTPAGTLKITLTSTDNSANDATATAATDGSFNLTVAPDTYTVSIYHFLFPGGYTESDQTYTSVDTVDL